MTIPTLFLTQITKTILATIILMIVKMTYGSDFMVDDMKLNQDQLPTKATNSSFFKSAIEGREYRWVDNMMPFKIDDTLSEWIELIQSTISDLNQRFCGCFYIR